MLQAETCRSGYWQRLFSSGSRPKVERAMSSSADAGKTEPDKTCPSAVNAKASSKMQVEDVQATRLSEGEAKPAAPIEDSAEVANGTKKGEGPDDEKKELSGKGEEGPARWLRKRRIALFMGYLGGKYQGMQRNPGVITIEGVLMEALVKAGCVAKEMKEEYSRLKWSRSARTDKGVSAVGQVVSADLKSEQNGSLKDEIIDEINRHLPDDIRIFGWLRSTGGFAAKGDCARRRYEYVLPVEALESPRELQTGAGADGGANDQPNGPQSQSDLASRIEEFNKILKRYEGSHNFHNFTDRMAGTDASAYRFIISIICSQPFDISGSSFVRVTILGQSFVLHQIRKMMGLALQVLWSGIPSEVINVCMLAEKDMPIPTAPALGLLLAETYFTFYNRRYKQELKQEIALDSFHDKVEAFKKDKIYEFIAEREKSTRSMYKWIRQLPESFHIDKDTILGDFELLKNVKEDAREKRKRRLDALYPVFEELEEMFPNVDDETLKRKKEMATSIKRRFDQRFGSSPSSFSRIPGALLLVGDLQEAHNLDCVGISTSAEVIAAVARSSGSEYVELEHNLSDLSGAKLRPSGVRLASTEDPSRTDWSRSFSWGWQCGVSGKGVRPKSLPAASVFVGGELSYGDEVLDADSAQMLSALLSFMDLHSWKLARSAMAQMSFAWDKQGRGSSIGLWRHVMSLEGAADTLVRLTYLPKPAVSLKKFPLGLRLVAVYTEKAETQIPMDELMISQKKFKAESHCCALLLGKRLGLDWESVKSLGHLLEVGGNSTPEGKINAIAEKLLGDTDVLIPLSNLAEELEVDMSKLNKLVPDSVKLESVRLQTIVEVALHDLKALNELWDMLPEAPQQIEPETLDKISSLTAESERLRSLLEPEDQGVRSRLRKICEDSGMRSVKTSSLLSGRATPHAIGMVTSENYASVSESLNKLKTTEETQFSFREIALGASGSVWASMKKPLPRKKRKEQYT